MPGGPDEPAIATPIQNRFDRMEVAGAFGDLGTLVPFVVAYIGVLKMDPFGVLLAFSLAMIVCGFVYRTPIPVQPMKAAGAIATTQAAQTIVITPAIVWGASLATGIVWLLLGLTGTARYVTRLITRPVVLGIILGLGFGFMIEGAKMMAQNWWIGGAALLGTSLLLTNRIIPAMFLLLLFGAAYGILSDASLLAALREVHVELRLPAFALSGVTFNDLLIGTVFLALPQVPLTLGNAVIAIAEETNRSTSANPDEPIERQRGRRTDVPWCQENGRSGAVRGKDRRSTRNARHRLTRDGHALWCIGGHAPAPISARDPRGHPLVDRSPARPWRL